MRLYSLIQENGIDVKQVIPVIAEGLKVERLNRDAQKLLGNEKAYMESEVKISQAELFLNILRFNQ